MYFCENVKIHIWHTFVRNNKEDCWIGSDPILCCCERKIMFCDIVKFGVN